MDESDPAETPGSDENAGRTAPPNFEFQVARVLRDGPCTFFQSINEPPDSATGWWSMSLIREAEDGRVSVLRQVSAQYHQAEFPCAEMAGIGYPTGDAADTRRNKVVVRRFTRAVMDEAGAEVIDKYVDRDVFVSHAPERCASPAVYDEIIERRRPRAGKVYHGVDNLVGEGDFVAIFSCFDEGGQFYRACDLFRLNAGRIVEHWDVVQEVAPYSVADNDDT